MLMCGLMKPNKVYFTKCSKQKFSVQLSVVLVLLMFNGFIDSSACLIIGTP